MRTVIGLIVFVLISNIVVSQELNCQVQVNSQKIEGTNKKVFQTLQTTIFEFINNKRWTNYNYKLEERIECSMILTIESYSSDEFQAKINIAARRPIYKTSLNAPILNFVDKNVDFEYIEYEAIEFNEGVVNNNLAAVLAYYAYTIIGLDFDSYTRFGGTPFFEKAQEIANIMQSTDKVGWKAFESQKNRYWMSENLLNPSYAGIREAMYDYHRMGMDRMAENMEQGRQSVMASVETLQKVYRERPGVFLLQLTMETKADELKNIFSGSSQMDKVRMVNILSEIDPANASKYQRLLKQ
ncbi:MAG: DUF4835 family protein [Bacteroidales bacterium]|nr:DUF4835 family protein [Bacteroidales bacterium]